MGRLTIAEELRMAEIALKRIPSPDALWLLEMALRDRGFDGLYSTVDACWCWLGGLAPCDGGPALCRAGHEVECRPGGGPCDERCPVHGGDGPRDRTMIGPRKRGG